MDKMAAISQTIFSDAFLWMKGFVYWLRFHWSFTIDNNQALVYVMAWRRIDDKPLSEPMRIRLTEAYMRQQGEMK